MQREYSDRKNTFTHFEERLGGARALQSIPHLWTTVTATATAVTATAAVAAAIGHPTDLLCSYVVTIVAILSNVLVSY